MTWSTTTPTALISSYGILADGKTAATATVNTTAVPLTLLWKATGNVSLKEAKLTAPLARTYGPTVTSAAKTGTWAVKSSSNYLK